MSLEMGRRERMDVLKIRNREEKPATCAGMTTQCKPVAPSYNKLM